MTRSAIARRALRPNGRWTRSSRTRFLRAILHRGIPASSAQAPLVTSLEGPHLPEDAERTLPMADVVAVSRPAHADRTFLQALASLFGAAGLALLMGVAILLIGLPIALVVRGLLEAISWLFGIALH